MSDDRAKLVTELNDALKKLAEVNNELHRPEWMNKEYRCELYAKKARISDAVRRKQQAIAELRQAAKRDTVASSPTQDRDERKVEHERRVDELVISVRELVASRAMGEGMRGMRIPFARVQAAVDAMAYVRPAT